MPDAAAHDDRLELLRAVRRGSEEARRALLGHAYTEMRRLAHRVLAGPGATPRLQPSALVQDAAQRVLDLGRLDWRERAHFLAIAAPLMRQALMDEVRRARTAPRPVAPPTASFAADLAATPLDLEQLDAELRELQAIDRERARLVELRFFAGLTIDETAEVLELSPATAARRWHVSRAWLLRRLGAVS